MGDARCLYRIRETRVMDGNSRNTLTGNPDNGRIIAPSEQACNTCRTPMQEREHHARMGEDVLDWYTSLKSLVLSERANGYR